MKIFLLLLVLVVALAAVVAIVNRRKFREANQLVPGVESRAPASWAGAHTPEARLHRRLRDALASLRANPSVTEVGLLEARVALEQHALAVDERLVAVASLPQRTRAGALAPVAEAVDAVEAAVTSLLTAGSLGRRSPDVDRAVADVNERVALLAEARTELDPPPGMQSSTG